MIKTDVEQRKDILDRLQFVERILARRKGGGGGNVPLVSMPAPQAVLGPTSSTLTSTSFEDMPSMATITINAPATMYARIDMATIIADNAAAYTMLGATVSGATTLSETQDGGITAGGSNLTPFGYSAGELFGSKLVLLNAGTNVITLRRRKSAASGSSITNYSMMAVTPIAIVGSPAVQTDTGWTDLTPYLTGGFTASAGNIEGRRIGDEIELRGSMSAPSTAAGSGAIDFLDGIPEIFRPTKRIGFGSGVNNGYALLAYSRPAGTVALNLRDGLAAGSTQFTTKYFAG